MKRVMLVGLLALAWGGNALAQTGAGNTSANLSGGVTKQTGIAKPPRGVVPPQPRHTDRLSGPRLGNNTPTLPQIALHPTATIGSPVPIAGPGGSSKFPTGN
jgi:hypothetical protein